MDNLQMAPLYCWIMVGFTYFYVVIRLILQIIIIGNPPHIDQEEFDKNEHGHGMVVVLSGYKSSRAVFIQQLDEMRRVLSKDYSVVYAPHLIYDPDKTIMESNTGVLSYIRQFCFDHPNEPILIVGISAGGRLAIYLSNALQMARIQTRIHIITLGSPLKGTSLVRILPGVFHLAKYMVGKTMIEEFDPYSNKQLELSQCILNSEMDHTFFHFYSNTDWMVFPPHYCATPLGPPKAYSKSIYRCAHNRIQVHHEVLSYLSKFHF